MPLALIVVAGAALRFATLGVQSFSDDELFTVWLVRMPFDDLLSTLPDSEATPPLFYVLEWISAQLFGTGEVGMRLLPALAGTLTIPVVYAAAANVASRRAGLAAAALVAVNPFLVWYSQEARAYALLIVLVAVSLMWLFAYAREERTAALAGWAIASAAALATHYFALFVVAPAGVWLLVAGPGEMRRRAVAVAGPALAGLALLPLALHQRSTVSDPGGLGGSALIERVTAIPKNFLVGFSISAEVLTSAAAGVLAAAGLVMALRAAEPERGGARLAALFATAGVALPLAVAPLGFDYVSSRNVVAALIPFAIVLGCGFATTRVGRVALAALCTLSVATVIGIAATPEDQRRDWRGAAEALGPASSDRVVVFSPPFSNVGPFRVYYGTRAELYSSDTPPVDEVAVVALAETGGFGPGAPEPPDAAAPTPPRGFRVTRDVRTATYRVIRYRAVRPRTLGYGQIAAFGLPGVRAVIVRQPGGRP